MYKTIKVTKETWKELQNIKLTKEYKNMEEIIKNLIKSEKGLIK